MNVIPTRYKGILYRSRTEARWAVFFDVLDAHATYEPEGFNLDGSWYLPDFLVLSWNLFVEVKPENPTPFERGRCAKLSAATGRPVLMVCGAPSEGRGALFRDGTELPGNATFAECRRCGTLTIHVGDRDEIILTAPAGEERCTGAPEPGGYRVEGATMAAANERFGVYPDEAA